MILTRFFHQSSCRSDLPTHLVQRYLDPLEKISGFDWAALYYRRYDPIFLARHFWPRYYKRPISGVKVPPRASQAPSWVPSLSWPDACESDLSGRDHEESLHRYSHARHPAPHAGHPIHHLDNLQLS